MTSDQDAKKHDIATDAADRVDPIVSAPVSLADQMAQSQREEEQWRDEQHAKMGDYDNPEDGCPNCGRHRTMKGDDGKHRCEKCAWCIEDNDYDSAFLEYLR